MKKTIIHKELYQAPQCKEYNLTINRGILDGSYQENPTGSTTSFNEPTEE